MWEESVEKFTKAGEISKNDLNIYNYLSISYLNLDKFDEAIEQINNVLRINPNFAPAYYNVAGIYMKKQEFDKAIENYKKAISIDSSLKKAYFNIAGAYYSLGDIKNAVKYWEKSLQYDKNNPDIYMNLANVNLKNLDNKVKAMRYIRSAYDIRRNDPKVVCRYADFLLQTNDIYRAIDKYIEAYKIDSNMSHAIIGHAECLVKLRKYDEALDVLNNCDDNAKNSVSYLMIRLMALNEIALKHKQNQNMEEYEKLNGTIIEVCDKIVEVSGNDKLVAGIKKLHRINKG